MMDLVVHFDGGGSSVGGPGAWGVVLTWADDGGLVEEFAGWHPDLTNNEAEYHGLIAALRCAQRYAPLRSLVVRGDSQLVIRQTAGKYRCKSELLRPLMAEAQWLVQALGCVTLEWVKRTENKRADELATMALRAGGPVREPSRNLVST